MVILQNILIRKVKKAKMNSFFCHDLQVSDCQYQISVYLIIVIIT